mgnify:CR=1 FL=1
MFEHNKLRVCRLYAVARGSAGDPHPGKGYPNHSTSLKEDKIKLRRRKKTTSQPFLDRNDKNPPKQDAGDKAGMCTEQGLPRFWMEAWL